MKVEGQIKRNRHSAKKKSEGGVSILRRKRGEMSYVFVLLTGNSAVPELLLSRLILAPVAVLPETIVSGLREDFPYEASHSSN